MPSVVPLDRVGRLIPFARLAPASGDQPACAVAELDREPLQRAGTGRHLDGPGQRFECVLRTTHHLAGADIVERCVPPALEAPIVRHVPVTEGGKEMAASIGYRERLS